MELQSAGAYKQSMHEPKSRKEICERATSISAANRRARKVLVRQFCEQARKSNPTIAGLSRREFQRFVKSASRLCEPSVSQAVEELLGFAFGELSWMRILSVGPGCQGTSVFLGAALPQALLQHVLQEANAS